MIEVQLPDGSITSIETDDPKAAAAAAKKFWEKSQAPKKEEAPKGSPNVIPSYDAMGNVTGMSEVAPEPTQMPYGEQMSNAANTILKASDKFVRGAAKGATFGMADRIAAFARSKTEGIPYDQALKEEVSRTNSDIQSMGPMGPVSELAGGAGLVGGLSKAGLTLLGRLPTPTTFLGKLGTVGAGTAEGATYGALQGAGATYTGNKEDYLNAAKHGAAVGGALGGALTAAPLAWNAAKQALGPNGQIAQAAKNITPAQYQAAETLVRDAEQRGVKLTAAEALDYVTGNATGLGRVQRIVESTEGGGNVMAPAMAERVPQMQKATEDVLNTISPPVSRPYDLPIKTQQVGEQIMSAADKARTAAVNPYYNAAKGKDVNPNAVKAIVDELRGIAAADETGILAKPLNEMQQLLIKKQGVPEQVIPRQLAPGGKRYEPAKVVPAQPEEYITNVENLDRARKFLREKIDLPAFAAQATSKEQGAQLTARLNNLRDRMERNVPEFATGRQVYEDITRNRMEPFKASPTGQLAEAQTAEAQRALLFPSNPAPGSERAIGNAFKSIAARDPELAQSLIRQEVERIANRTVEGLTAAGVPNQYGGAALATAVRRNPQVEANLNEALRGAGKSPENLSGLLDVLQATGSRQRPGSMTAFNTEFLKSLEAGGASGLAQKAASPLASVREFAARQALNSRAEEMAKMLLSGPEGVQAIQRIAQYGTGEEAALARAVLYNRLNQVNMQRGKREAQQ